MSTPHRIGGRPRYIASTVVPAVVITVLWSVPLFGLFVSSFRDEDSVKSTGWWTALADPFATDWTFENYRTVIENELGGAFLNSAVVSIPATVLPVVIASFAAYAFAWMKFRGSEVLFGIIIALLVVPIIVAFIPLLKLYGSLGLNGRFAAVWLAHTGFAMPLAVYLIRNHMSQIPRSLIDAARLDGATEYQIFWRVAAPLSLPMIAAFAILQFLWVWNDFVVALIFLGSDRENQMVQQAVTRLIGNRSQDWHLLTAGGFVSIVVPLIVFFTLQRFFVRGLAAGAEK